MRASTWLGPARRALVPVAVAVLAGGCAGGPVPLATYEEGVEHMPGPASIRISSDPASPEVAVRVDVTGPDDPRYLRSHAFPAGGAVVGDIPVSEGRYRVAGQGGACTIDLVLGPEQEADVVITPDASSGCTLGMVALHGFADPRFRHPEPGVLIAPGSRGAVEEPHP